jgi:hypothetical protein
VNVKKEEEGAASGRQRSWMTGEDDEELEFDNGDPYIAFWAATNASTATLREERVIASLADGTSSTHGSGE